MYKRKRISHKKKNKKRAHCACLRQFLAIFFSFSLNFGCCPSGFIHIQDDYPSMFAEKCMCVWKMFSCVDLTSYIRGKRHRDIYTSTLIHDIHFPGKHSALTIRAK